MRYLVGLICVLALGVMGCSETAGTGGFPCTEQGIRDAIAEGGGPHTFACDGPTTVVAEDAIELGDVILDGEGNLTVVGDYADNGVIVNLETTAELIGFVVIGGESGFAIRNFLGGTLTLTGCTASGARVGIFNGNMGLLADPTVLTIANSTVSGNGVGIISFANGELTLTNSTVSGNIDGGIGNSGLMELTNTTVSNDNGPGISNGGTLTVANSLIDGGCSGDGDLDSNGYNIESSGDTCGFDQPTDQVNVTAAELKPGELADNGGPTETHALEAGSVAIDQIPEADCEVTEDQRGEPRPETGGTMCDVGAVEVQP